MTASIMETDEFLEQVWRLNPDELRALAGADADDTFVARGLARRTAGRAAREHGRLQRLQEVHGLIGEWAAAAGSSHPYQLDYMVRRDELEARRGSLMVLLDAATAAVLWDVLPAEDVDALWGPWQAFGPQARPATR